MLMVGSSSISQAGARVFSDRDVKVDFIIFFYNLLTNLVFSSIIFIAAYILDFGLNQEEILFICFLSLFQSTCQILESYYNSRLERKRYYIQTISQSFLKILFVVILFISEVVVDTETLLLCLVLSFFFPLYISLPEFKKIITFGFLDFSLLELRSNFTRVLLISLPISFLALFSWAKEAAPRWLLLDIDIESVANYSVLIAISTVASVFLLKVFNLYFYPKIYSPEVNNSHALHIVKRASFIYLLVVSSVSLFIYLFDKEIVVLLTSPIYSDSASYLSMIFFATSVNSIGSFSTHLLYKLEKTKKLVMPNLYIACFFIFLSYFSIRFYGENGAIFSYFIVYIFSGIYLFTYSVTYNEKNCNKV